MMESEQYMKRSKKYAEYIANQRKRFNVILAAKPLKGEELHELQDDMGYKEEEENQQNTTTSVPCDLS